MLYSDTYVLYIITCGLSLMIQCFIFCKQLAE